MPSLYAHKAHGALVYKELPAYLRKICARNYEYYLAGLHGPDVLFFHPPGVNEKVADIGRKAHRKPFSLQYKRAHELLSGSLSEEDFAYFAGCLCHFVLDKTCHPLVDECIRETGLSHGKTEMELDRLLLTGRGYAPLKYPMYAHIPVSREVASAAARFYKGVSEKEFFIGLASIKTINALCSTNSTLGRKMLCEIMDRAGETNKIASLIMSRDTSIIAKPYVKKMAKAMNACVPETVDLITKFYDSIGEELVIGPELKLNYSGK